MTPQFHPFLVNSRYEDPVVYVDFRFSKRSILFDLGDITALPEKKILRITDIFISHTHVDHFIGFDHLLRILLGRERTVRLFGPEGLVDSVGHKLAAYTWNLAPRMHGNLTFVATEIDKEGVARSAEFTLREHFRKSRERSFHLSGDIVHEEESFTVRRACLDHGIPCFAYALQERVHINVWKNRLLEMGLGTGPWLNELKEAILRGDPDDRMINASWQTPEGIKEREFPLGLLKREYLRFVPGQKIVYVTDALYSEENRRRIVDLARDADILFIETTFAGADAALGKERGHLTTYQAGNLAGRAGVRRVESMHFSSRYETIEDEILEELARAFSGDVDVSGVAE